MKKIFSIALLSLMMVSCSDSNTTKVDLPFHTEFKTTEGWSLDAGAKFDPSVSASEGSGSIRLQKAGESWVTSDRITSDIRFPVKAGATYTISFKSKTQTFPPPLLEVYGAMSSGEGFIENSDGTMCTNSQKGVWEDNHVIIKIPNNQMIKYFQIKILMLPKRSKNAPIWIDDVRFSEGVVLPDISAKKSFLGSITRIDKEGNIEIKQNGKFVPFFPIGIYTDEDRKDWSIYRKLGFNMNMWASNVASIRKSKESGLYSMMQIVQYMVPVDPAWIPQDEKKKKEHLKRTLESIQKENLWDNLLFYYVDNEFYTLDKKFTDIIDIVRHEDKNAHPIYMLNGAYGLARMYNDFIDLTGTYVAKDGYETPIVENFLVLNTTQNQKIPVVFAQINRGVGKNFKPILYGAIAKGVKGVGFWRDGGSAGDIAKRAVAMQLPQVAKEIAQMMPVVRAPLAKNEEQGSCDNEKLLYGTKITPKEGYMIISNPTRKKREAQCSFTHFPYTIQKVEDYFSHQKAGDVKNNSFKVSLEPYEAKVLKLVK